MQTPFASIALAAALALSLTLILPLGPARAQGLAGTVLDRETRRGLEGVHLVLHDSAGAEHGAVLSKEEGEFSLEVPFPGEWTLKATRPGYAPLHSEAVFAGPQELVLVQVWMTVDPIELDERIVVTERRSYATPDLRDFQRRREQGERTGFGRFITRQDVERLGPSRASDLLRSLSRVRVGGEYPGRAALIRMSSGCIPAIYVDGSHINRNRRDALDDYVSALSVEAVEMYRGGYHQVGRFNDPFGCGLILVWTRRGHHQEGRFTWAKLGFGVSLLAAFFLIF